MDEISLIRLGSQPWYKDGLHVIRADNSVHQLVTTKYFNEDNFSVSDEGVAFVLTKVCRGCDLFEDCLLEITIPRGRLSTKPVSLIGAGIHTDECMLVDVFIPDSAFRG